MTRDPDPRVLVFTTRPTTWLAKLAYGVIGLALMVIAFFFLTVALVAGALVALALIGRLWWISRKLRRPLRQSELEGEFTVVEHREPIQRIDKKR